MKNNLKAFFTIFFLCATCANVLAVEDFLFESKSIEIKDNSNISAKDGVKVTTSDGLEIFADESEYSKDTKILILEKNVVILDKIQKLEISSDNITYNRLLEEIKSNIKTEIKINDSHVLLGENVIFLRSKFKIYSENPTTIKDKTGHYIKSNLANKITLYYTNLTQPTILLL